MRQWLTKIQRVVNEKKIMPGIILLIALVLFSMAGLSTRYFIKRNGVYATATVLDVEYAPRGRFDATVKYSFMSKSYQEVVSFNPDFVNMEFEGKRIVIVLLPKHPTMFICIEHAPDCLDDSPPEGWTEIPECE